MLTVFQENDFDFGDRQRGTLLDDEDLMNDEGSGPDDEDFSGTTTEVAGGTRIKTVFPSHTTTAAHQDVHEIGKFCSYDYYKDCFNLMTNQMTNLVTND